MGKMIAPKTQYNIIMGLYTALITIPVFLMIIIALITSHLPYTDRNRVLVWFEYHIMRVISWRNQRPAVKRAYDRAHLFEHIKSFK